MQDAIIMYENGKAIGGEGHPTDAGDITFDNTGTDLVSENVEDAIKEVNAKTSGVVQETLAWTNPSPEASFVAQSITMLGDTDYDRLKFVFYGNATTGAKYCMTVETETNYGFIAIPMSGGGTNLSVRERYFSVSGNTVTFDNATTQTQGSSATTNNAVLIPAKIYKLKRL